MLPPQPDEEDDEPDKNRSQQLLLDTARRAVLSEAVRLAEEICEGRARRRPRGPAAVRGQPSEALENAMYDRVVATEDRNEALAAFADRRKPVFKGR